MVHSGKAKIPMKTTYKTIQNTTQGQDVISADKVLEYQRILGQMNWLAIKTRPDIAFATNRLQRKSHGPLVNKPVSFTIITYYCAMNCNRKLVRMFCSCQSQRQVSCFVRIISFKAIKSKMRIISTWVTSFHYLFIIARLCHLATQGKYQCCSDQTSIRNPGGDAFMKFER
jgi:hypothetical protein